MLWGGDGGLGRKGEWVGCGGVGIWGFCFLAGFGGRECWREGVWMAVGGLVSDRLADKGEADVYGEGRCVVWDGGRGFPWMRDPLRQ